MMCMTPCMLSGCRTWHSCTACCIRPALFSSQAVPRWISRGYSPQSYVIGEHGVHTQYLRRISLCSPAAEPRCPIWSLLRCLWERERKEAFPRVPFALLHAACEQRPAVFLSLSFSHRKNVAYANRYEKHDPRNDWALQITNFAEGKCLVFIERVTSESINQLPS